MPLRKQLAMPRGTGHMPLFALIEIKQQLGVRIQLPLRCICEGRVAFSEDGAQFYGIPVGVASVARCEEVGIEVRGRMPMYHNLHVTTVVILQERALLHGIPF